ncbi:MAG: type II secretion system F family protein [Pseudomonadota bacterium]|nr:type II secretion system F family protein [Pseudomonadota bacterium]
MARFSYTARERTGELTEGTMEATDESAVAKLLLARNVIPIKIVASKDEPASGSEKSMEVHWYTPNVSLDELVIFCRQMFSLTRAGIPILRAVSGLAESSNSVRMRVALLDVIAQLERGRSLSSALHLHSDIFNQLFVSIIHVGENTGRLDDAFLQLAEYLEREQETRKQIKAATRYPVFVLIALALAFVVLNVFVIPKFATMFAKFGAELPTMTKVLLAISDFMINRSYILIGIIALISYGIYRYVSTENGRYKWDRLKLRLPVVGDIIRRSLLARFSRSFSMMLHSGVPLTNALNLVADAVDNAYVSASVIEMRQRIEKGENLTRVSRASGLFTPMIMQMINVGEETGRVDELLAEVAGFYEREVDYDLKSLTAKIEPFLIVIVAGMVLILALGIFSPMWDMMSAIKGGR